MVGYTIYMTQRAALTETQTRTAITALGQIALSETGEVSEHEVRTCGGYVHMNALPALVTKGWLTVRYGDRVATDGPYAGQVLSNQRFYSVAE